MHEFSVARSLISVVLRELERLHARGRVARVFVTVGELSGVVPEALRLAFDLAAAGSALEGAELCVEEVPLVLHCDACDRQWHATEPFLACEECGGMRVTVVSGRELGVTGVDLEEEAPVEGQPIG
jgi:hydrogenase nickel incorporation protein HypA/HybF